MMKNEFAVTATESMRFYAGAVIQHLKNYSSLSGSNIDATNDLLVKRFADGEMEVEVISSMRGKDVILFASSARNEAGLSVNDAKIELYHTIDALKRSRCGKIIVFEPYVSCSRSDRPLARNSVGLWVHFKTLVSLGTEHIVTYQLHSDKSKAMLDPAICVLDDIPIFTLLKKHLCDNYIKDLNTLENVVRNTWAFCSVDAGGEKITRRFANAFGAPLVIAHKQRDYSRANTVESINILSAEPLDGKILWIVDDMIDTGGSVISLINALTKQNPKEINIIAVHAPFSGEAASKLSDLYHKNMINRIIVSDTTYFPPAIPQMLPSLQIVSTSELSALVIRHLVSSASMANIHESFNAHEYLANCDLFLTC
ncbi:MAG: ribose-phosphate diphosphokinase [Termitinemataceae bacterium]|nr:MAG: ribose-phosphate diphosphokinase [Termitinemataceae bacterium]